MRATCLKDLPIVSALHCLISTCTLPIVSACVPVSCTRTALQETSEGTSHRKSLVCKADRKWVSEISGRGGLIVKKAQEVHGQVKEIGSKKGGEKKDSEEV